jgi:hypothetical protein
VNTTLVVVVYQTTDSCQNFQTLVVMYCYVTCIAIVWKAETETSLGLQAFYVVAGLIIRVSNKEVGYSCFNPVISSETWVRGEIRPLPRPWSWTK